MVVVFKDTDFVKLTGTVRQGYFLDNNLKANLDIFKERVKNKFDGCMLLTGGEGTGKSTLAQAIGYYLNPGKLKLENLNSPYIVVPGPMDTKPPAWEYWKRYIGEYDPLFENDLLYFQGINSTTSDSNTGFIGRKRLNTFIEKVLSLSHQKIFGVCCHHSLIPTPLSVWRTELIDSGDVLSQFAVEHRAFPLSAVLFPR